MPLAEENEDAMPTIEELLAAKQQRIDALHQARPGETALLVIDMQHGFVHERASLCVEAAQEIVPNIGRLVAACRERSVPVIFTEFVYDPSVPCLRGDPFGPEHLPAEPGAPTGLGRPSSNCLIGAAAGTGVESAATIDALAPQPGELVVRGHTYDKFYGTPLDLALRSGGIRYLLMTGVTTDVCVNSTLIAASSRNYRVTAVTDAVASPWPELHEACFKIWRPKFARLRSTAELLEELSQW